MTHQDDAPRYEIRLQGHLDARRAERFAGMRITLLDSGVTQLVGPVPDQAALYGILDRIRDMGVALLTVRRLAPSGTGDIDDRPASGGPQHRGDDHDITQ